jgi:hypothetical protein
MGVNIFGYNIEKSNRWIKEFIEITYPWLGKRK